MSDANLGRGWDDLGERWEVDGQYWNPEPVRGGGQQALTAASQLLVEHPPITADRVAHVLVEAFQESRRQQGHFASNGDEAQYGLAYTRAALIARGQVGPDEVTGEAIFADDILWASVKTRD